MTKHQTDKETAEVLYPACRRMMDSDTWESIVEIWGRGSLSQDFPEVVALQKEKLKLPGFIPELARLEHAFSQVRSQDNVSFGEVSRTVINPTLQLLQVSWKHLSTILNSDDDTSFTPPEEGAEYVLVWKDPQTGSVRSRSASKEDLLVLKLVVENVDPLQAVSEVAGTAPGGVSIGAIDAAIHRGVSRGILLAPPSRIRRDPVDFPIGKFEEERFRSTTVFTLQWHITQACDLHCKHCYDRRDLSSLQLEKGIAILDDFQAFCRERNVRGQVSFTGGNPLLYPQFSDLYRAGSERGFSLAILGNPASRDQLEELLRIQKPVFFQVSLEGLTEYNDYIRGTGHFAKTVVFLELLRDLKISSKVMLTLTADNLDQVIPLGEELGNLTDDFTFNRLSQVGEGANLQLPSEKDFATFLEAYMKASKNNRAMGLKDSLFNIVRLQQGRKLFGGCTGYGCGAAFNFLCVLSDGEVHACRKFPSPIGNIFEQSLGEIYDSGLAERYRSGPESCQRCSIRIVCRGCMAIAFSHGLDVFQEHDPYCFIPDEPHE